MGHPKTKKKKKIVAQSGDTGYVAKLKEKAEQISALEQQLTGNVTSPTSAVQNDTENLKLQLTQAMADYAAIVADYQAHPPSSKATIEDKKYFYTFAAAPLVNALMAHGIKKEQALFVASQALLEQGTIPSSANKKTIWGVHNLLNVKAVKTQESVDIVTHEEDKNGVSKIQHAKFAKYKDVPDAVDSYLNLLQSNFPDAYDDLYKPDATIEDFAKDLQNGKTGKYATDTGYVNKMIADHNSVAKDYDKYAGMNLTDPDKILTIPVPANTVVATPNVKAPANTTGDNGAKGQVYSIPVTKSDQAALDKNNLQKEINFLDQNGNMLRAWLDTHQSWKDTTDQGDNKQYNLRLNEYNQVIKKEGQDKAQLIQQGNLPKPAPQPKLSAPAKTNGGGATLKTGGTTGSTININVGTVNGQTIGAKKAGGASSKPAVTGEMIAAILRTVLASGMG